MLSSKILVHRFQLIAELTVVDLPVRSRVLHVAWKSGEPCPSVWYAFNPDDAPAKEQRRFLLIGTGQELATTYVVPVGSFIAPDSFHVFHVFEERP